jgi:hypothetical protein
LRGARAQTRGRQYPDNRHVIAVITGHRCRDQRAVLNCAAEALADTIGFGPQPLSSSQKEVAMETLSYPEFESEALAEGFDEVLERRWSALSENEVHTHPFAVKALVVQGEMWLTVGKVTRHLRAGDGFELDHDEAHSERYGSDGATYWAARRNPVTARA